MDRDKLEFRHQLVSLAGGAAAFAGSCLSPWSVTAAGAVVVFCAAATLLVLRRADFGDLSMARRVRLSFVCIFGFVLARLTVPVAEWEWWMPLLFPAAVFVPVSSCIPSKIQRGRLARAFPVEGADSIADSPVGRGWWFASYGVFGIVSSILLRTLRIWGWPGTVFLLIALCVPLLPLRKLAKRREAQTAKPWRADPAAGPLFPV